MGKITLVILLGLGVFLAASVLKDRDLEFAKSVVPKCGDPEIKIRLPKYTLEGKQKTLKGLTPVKAPPGVKIDDKNRVLYRLIVSDLPLQETIANTQEKGGQVFPNSTFWDTVEFPNKKKFQVYYPAGSGATPTKFNIVSDYIHPGQADNLLYFADWGLVFLVHFENNQRDVKVAEGRKNIYWLVDVYQDITYPAIPNPQKNPILECTNKIEQKNQSGPFQTLQISAPLKIGKTVEEWDVIFTN